MPKRDWTLLTRDKNGMHVKAATESLFVAGRDPGHGSAQNKTLELTLIITLTLTLTLTLMPPLSLSLPLTLAGGRRVLAPLLTSTVIPSFRRRTRVLRRTHTWDRPDVVAVAGNGDSR